MQFSVVPDSESSASVEGRGPPKALSYLDQLRKCFYSPFILHANKQHALCAAGVGLTEASVQLGFRGLRTTGPRGTKG